VEKLCDLCNITVNKNAVFGDSSALAPGGVRIGNSLLIDVLNHKSFFTNCLGNKILDCVYLYPYNF